MTYLQFLRYLAAVSWPTIDECRELANVSPITQHQFDVAVFHDGEEFAYKLARRCAITAIGWYLLLAWETLKRSISPSHYRTWKRWGG